MFVSLFVAINSELTDILTPYQQYGVVTSADTSKVLMTNSTDNKGSA